MTIQKSSKEEPQKKEKLSPADVIIEHVSDGHEFHFATIGHRHFTIPLPVILYSPSKGLSVFMSSAFHHGEEVHEGYRLLTDEFMKEHGLDKIKDAKGHPGYKKDKIYAVNADGMPDRSVAIYDFSLTRYKPYQVIDENKKEHGEQ